MGWEPRRKRKYFYYKWREGKRVRSHYMGGGELAEAMNYLVGGDPFLKKLKLEIEGEELGVMLAEDAEAETISDYVETFAKASLVIEGFFPHKGEWRKKRRVKD